MLKIQASLGALHKPKTPKKRTCTPGGGGGLVAQNAEIWGQPTHLYTHSGVGGILPTKQQPDHARGARFPGTCPH